MLLAAAEPVAAADPPSSGEALFKRNCGTCHVISPTPAQRQGPNLYGVVGRHAGRLEAFAYSEALKNADLVWTDTTLDAWLTDASHFVPGSVMPYRQADPAVRSAIIDYLKIAGGSSTAAPAPKGD
ncbi:MAG TPA: c-type cytochrome [Stellaceae bacterium]